MLNPVIVPSTAFNTKMYAMFQKLAQDYQMKIQIEHDSSVILRNETIITLVEYVDGEIAYIGEVMSPYASTAPRTERIASFKNFTEKQPSQSVVQGIPYRQLFTNQEAMEAYFEEIEQAYRERLDKYLESKVD